MQKILVLVCTLLIISCKPDSKSSDSFTTVFEASNEMASATYEEGISWWMNFAGKNDYAEISTFGMTDAGKPLRLIILSKQERSLKEVYESSKATILINNAIHPGEPDGVDASMMLFRDILADQSQLLDSCNLVCIPFYNVGGSLNRNAHSRANQNGPIQYGFRGNAQNLDLNRDFVKCDSRNAETFAQLLQQLDPDFYIETHVSNGADYQYNISYLSTQPSKLGFAMGPNLENEIIPSLEKLMIEKGEPMVPYVNVHGVALDSSYETFYDSPRYSSGLTTLHHIYGFITETHMLKPFSDRVWATYRYLMSSIEYCHANNSSIQKSRNDQRNAVKASETFTLDWEVDFSSSRSFDFNGYAYGYKPSDISGLPRLYYDTTKPITKSMQFYNQMKPRIQRTKPKSYILKRGYVDVENRLLWNGVTMTEIEHDTLINVVAYKISNYETGKTAYEKHYSHYNTQFTRDTLQWLFHQGDYVIEMGKEHDRFVVEMLEPDGPDSYFNWNFFDAILQQKEWYSPYVFEDKASQLLEENAELKAEFNELKRTNPDFEANGRAQLHWLYLHSEHYEKEHLTLPFFRIE